MAFTPKAWVNEPNLLEVLQGIRVPSSSTPINAASLVDLERRVTDYADDITEAEAALRATGDSTNSTSIATLQSQLAALDARVVALEQGEADGLLIPFYDVVLWTNMPSASSEWWQYGRIRADLAGFVYARFTVTTSIVPATGTVLKAQYSADNGSNWADLTTTAAVDSLGSHSSTWSTIPTAARGDVLVRWVGSGSDGVADPEFYQPSVEFRRVTPSPAMSGGAGGGGGSGGSTYPKVATLTEGFTTNLDSYLTSGVPVLNGDGQLVLPSTALASGEYTTWIQRGPYDLDSSSVYITVDNPGTGTTIETGLQMRLDADSYISFFVTNGVLYSRVRTGGSNSDLNLGAWSDTNQRYIRIRHNAGNIEWHAGSDGSTWGSALRTVAAPSWAITALQLRVFSGYWGTESPTNALISSINLAQAEPSPGGGGGSTAALFNGAADLGLPGNWDQIQTSAQDAQFGATTNVSIVSSPVLLASHNAFAFQSQAANASNGPRAELAKDLDFSEGQERWFGDILRTNSSSWQSGNHTVMQWKNDGTGSPPIQLDIREWGNSSSGLGVYSAAWGFQQIIPMASIANTNHQIEVFIRFSSGSDGRIAVYLNGSGTAALDRTGATLYSGLQSYLKQGQYGNQASNIVYWLGCRVGTSRAAVQPSAR